MTVTWNRQLLNIAIFFCLGSALVLRFVSLDHIPGLNGDDAWMPVQLRNFFAGGEYTFRTPTHRWVSPTYAVAQDIFQILPFANVGLLRFPTALASLITVVLFPILFRKVLPWREVLIATLFLACLPIQVAYARSMGEMSQVPLVMTVLFYFLYKGNLIGALLALAVSISIHPTCALVLPAILCGVMANGGFKKYTNKKVMIPALLVLLVFGAWQVALLQWRAPNMIAMFILQLTDLEKALTFLNGIPRLFTGVNVVKNFIAPPTDDFVFWSDWMARIGLAAVIGYGSFRFWRQRKRARLWNLLGLVLSFAALYLASSPTEQALEPGFERYALFLIVPLSLQMASLVSEIKWGLSGLWAATIAGFAMLWSFHTNYLDAARTRGNAGHVTYRTANIEPKYAAYRWILQDFRAGNGSNLIVTEDWWTYWPFAYFNGANHIFQLQWLNPKGFVRDARTAPDPLQTTNHALSNRGYLVGFKGDRLDQYLSAQTGLKLQRADVRDYSGQVLLSVWRLAK